ncbi:AAA family ATPase [Aquihabitans sp. G128]|uniref:AAA family ATPase n=1 Tax=Aquihabitans sp. G128 TaxID=2849779 RepID=UPI001C217246|nr:AAA family ATPase [Aquihabitans sp. G128]QXC59213.1 AAA family ATPase [Aquihabitans sp. G128]
MTQTWNPDPGPGEPPTAPPSAVPGSGLAGGSQAFRALVDQVSGVVLGSPGPIRTAAAAFLASGHVLFEDIPGVGKTLLAKALAASIGGTFGRVQGTPDLLPSDLTGVTYLDDDRREWIFRPGPLFNNVVLVDELNRATPRTQSALLEAMAEGQVTVDGVTHPLPDPFFVVATQNPQSGDLGTFPLVGGQRDRFSVSLSLGLPGREAELQVLAGTGGDHALDALAPTSSLAEWLRLRAGLQEVYLHPVVAAYALDVIDTIRNGTGSRQPLSTRAGLALVQLARAKAVADGRSYVEPDDVQAVAVAGLAHRIIDVTNDDLPAARTWVGQLVRQVAVPPMPTGQGR